jgi:diguanylate cyclase (GGDEF)-like protein
VLVGAIDLQRPSFSGQLEALHATLDGYLFIVAADGTTIHHPDKEQILSRTAISSALTDAVLATPEGWRDDLPDDDGPILLSHRRLRRVDWTIAVSSPLHKVFAPMLSVRLRTLGATSALTVLAGLFAWVLIKLLVLPLARLHQNIDDIAAGKAGIDVFDIAREDEFGALSRAFYTLSQHQAETERDLHRLATTDALTGANNRRMFDAYFPTALARAHRAGQQVGLAILDVDKFKTINDTLGHAAGDAVLVEFARRLMRTVRCTDTVARLAGDEFVIVYEQLGTATEINILGNKILDAMAAPFQIGDAELPVTVSVGIALTTTTPATVDDVIRAADQALYGVKAAGRNGFAINYVGAERVVRSRARPAKEAGQEQVQAV